MLTDAPPDHTEATVIKLAMRIKTLGAATITGSREAWFEFHCEECGGFQIHLPDNPTDESTASCTACGQVFGTFGAVKALGRDLVRSAEQSEDTQKLLNLIERLRQTEPLSGVTAYEKRKTFSRKITEAMIATGASYGQATNAPSHLTQGEEHFRSEMKRMANNLGDQVRIVQQSLDAWFEYGEPPAPYYPARIPVILRKAKAFEMERNYLAAWVPHLACFHLDSPRVLSMLDRMRKLRIF